MSKIDGLDRYLGSILGLAVGDAVGTTLEFTRPGQFEPIQDMVGGGPFQLRPGEWTDDTSMAMCLLESLVESNGFDATDQMNRYVRWMRDGYWSSNGECFDIGVTVREALQQYGRTGNPFSGSTNPDKAGNGSIMRLAPVPLFYAQNPEQAVIYCEQSSRTTHGAKECLDACKVLGVLIISALRGWSKDEVLSSNNLLIEKALSEHTSPKIKEIALGSYKHKQPPEIRGTGYVVASLEAALWAFYHGETFKDGLLLAVNLGEDADTTGAVYGQLAGAFYGQREIPEVWMSMLARKEEMIQLSTMLYKKRV